MGTHACVTEQSHHHLPHAYIIKYMCCISLLLYFISSATEWELKMTNIRSNRAKLKLSKEKYLLATEMFGSVNDVKVTLL